MKKRFQALWARRPRWPRRRRVIRNLALAGLLALLLPWLLGWPVVTDRAVLAQLERAALLSPSELVLREGDAFLTEGEGWVTVGQLMRHGNWVKPFQYKMPYLNYVLPKGQLIVVALPEVVDDTLTVAVTGLPDQAASGTLSLTISDVRNPYEMSGEMEDQETFTAAAVRQGEWMLFRLEAHDHGAGAVCILRGLWREMWPGGGVAQYPYTLELRDSGGGVIEQKAGALPPEQRFLEGQFIY